MSQRIKLRGNPYEGLVKWFIGLGVICLGFSFYTAFTSASRPVFVYPPNFLNSLFIVFYPLGLSLLLFAVGITVSGNTERKLLKLLEEEKTILEKIYANQSSGPKSNDSSATVNASSNDNNVDRDKFIFDLINQRQTQEFQRSDDIDKKANNFLAFDMTIVGILIGAASIVRTDIVKQPSSQVGIFFVGISLFIVAIFFVFVSQRVRKWQIVPDVIKLVEKYANSPLQDVIEITGGEMAKNVLLLVTR
ncbi:MAG: hypothetical protein M1368_03470, partial [Thaumarchaeota archaeon]|nr:hypothetical protein [Nitrososphaerota archaeon]